MGDPIKRRPGIPRVGVPKRGSVDARAIRLATRGTQQGFADMIGVPVKTLRNWEQRRREPSGPARVLLAVIARDPWIVYGAATGQLGSGYSPAPAAVP
jgi:transcriptional regulator with XRE-family HTH domain